MPVWESLKFTDVEILVLKRLEKEFSSIKPGHSFNNGRNSYHSVSVSLTEKYKSMFNIEQDVIVVFDQSVRFDSKILEAITKARSTRKKAKVDQICSILISQCLNIENEIKLLLANHSETEVIIPFTIQELLGSDGNKSLISNRMRKHFYDRDLFAQESPLKNDQFFFGRDSLVHELVDRHFSNEVSGLFGLRKSGKTSVIFGVQRVLASRGERSVVIDCQNQSFQARRWNKALWYILDTASDQLKLKYRPEPEELFTEVDAGSMFEDGLNKIHNEIKFKNMLLIFDEIEHITYNVSPRPHWKNEMDFVYFWQTLRAIYQRQSKSHTFSYLIVGTNPLCVELATINSTDNPLFGQIPFQYIPRFDVPQTREMVRKLSKMMGLDFDEIIYGMLTEDFGGHPYLMRHVCSVIKRIGPSDRPTRVDKTLYSKAKKEFLKSYSSYFEMILSVLTQFFKDEYDMLTFLARGDTEEFAKFAGVSPEYTNHLIGYGIIEQVHDEYTFRIEAIKNHLLAKDRFRNVNMTQTEMRSEISERRNRLEGNLRKLCRRQLLAQFGKAKAREEVLKLLQRPQRNMSLSYEDLFRSNDAEIYFEDLRKIILKHWDCFKNVLGTNKEEVGDQLQTMNKLRKDAHAKSIDSYEMSRFRDCAEKLERKLEEFFS